ncbi:MAG: hypothetical protein H6581_26475 [Bacteroidia bacterium]|nr:hypothetical protein [Bacteroidia bacterium]
MKNSTISNLSSLLLRTLIVTLILITGYRPVTGQNLYIKDLGVSKSQVIRLLKKYPFLEITEEGNSIMATSGEEISIFYQFEGGELTEATLIKHFSSEKLAEAAYDSHLYWLELTRAISVTLTNEKHHKQSVAMNKGQNYLLTLNKENSSNFAFVFKTWQEFGSAQANSENQDAPFFTMANDL